ncbi:MAG TPA: amidohydrolase family protein [Chitinophagaceae bacterium]|jgi:predicted TIM-barrel fold metal-dependent hydrolase|nr:amidohydrolase family protein [Chitinophagaceae bacterium]
MQYYNVHSHVFTMKNAPQQFLSLYMPEVAASLIDKLTNTQAGAYSMAWILSKLPSSVARRYASFLKIGKSADQMSVFRTLASQYNDDPGFKFVGLTMYMENTGAMNSQTGFEGQLDGVLDIKRQYPDQFLIFMGIDPRWKGSARELRKTVESKFNYRLPVTATRSVFPFVGLKLYPSMGFYAFDNRLTETFEWAADNGVPVLSHCNYLGGIYNNDKTYLQIALNPMDPYTGKRYSAPKYQQSFKLGRWIFGTNKAENNKLSCSYFLEPSSFASLANYFHSNRQLSEPYDHDDWFLAYRKLLGNIPVKMRTPLKICLAHYGGDDQILMENNKVPYKAPIGVNPQNWCGQIRHLMTNYEGIYTDISYALSNDKIHDPIINDLENKVLGDRILFGTDFFLTERELPERKDYTIFRNKAQTHLMTRAPGRTAWDLIASVNTEKFLQSKYYNGNVI